MNSLPSLTSLPLAKKALHHHTTFEDLPHDIIRKIHLDARQHTGLDELYPSIKAGVFYIWKKHKRRSNDFVIRCKFILQLNKISDIDVKKSIEKIFKLEITRSQPVFWLHHFDLKIPFSDKDTFEKVVEVYTNKAKDAMLDVVENIYISPKALDHDYLPRLYVTPNESKGFVISFVFQGGIYKLRSGLQSTNKKSRNAIMAKVATDELLAEKHDEPFEPLPNFVYSFFPKPSNTTFSSHKKTRYS